MKKQYTLHDHIKESLKDPEFAKEWQKSELGFQLACLIIEARIEKNISQKQLAKKANTTQAVISRIENLNVSPSLKLAERIGKALGKKLEFSFS